MDSSTRFHLVRRIGAVLLAILAGGVPDSDAIVFDGPLNNQTMQPQSSIVINVAGAFSGGDDSYSASSSDTTVATVSVSGPNLTVNALAVGSATITVTGIDTDPNPDETAQGTFTVTVTNSAPVINTSSGAMPLLTPITEDEVLVVGVNFSGSGVDYNLLGALDIDDADESDSSLGIAVTAHVGNGSWQYLNTSSVWTDLPTLSGSNVFLLGAANRIRYDADDKNGETASLSFRLWDGTQGSALSTFAAATTGGSTAFSAQLRTSQLLVTSVQDPAELVLDATAVSGDDDETVSPFTDAEVNDVDLVPTADTLTVRITVDPQSNGFIYQEGSHGTAAFVETASNSGIYAASGSEAAVEAALRDLVFQPIANLAPVGSVTTTDLDIEVSDNKPATSSPADDDGTVVVSITSVNDPPSVGDIEATQFAFTRGSILAFASATVSDQDIVAGGGRQTVTLTVAETVVPGADGSWIKADGTPSDADTLTFSGISIDQAVTELRGLVYRATDASQSTPKEITLTVTVTDSAGGSTVVSTVVTVVTPQVTTDVRGTVRDQVIPDKSEKRVFENVIITGDIQSIEVWAEIAASSTNVLATSPAAGSFFEFGGGPDQFVLDGNILKFPQTGTASASAATEAIRRLVFKPTANYFSEPETIQFLIKLVYEPGAVPADATDSQTTAVVLPVNDLPTFIKFNAFTEITDKDTVPPFPLVEIGDVDELGQQELAVAIQLLSSLPSGTVTDPIPGVLSVPTSVTVGGFTALGGGVYSLSGTPLEITEAIQEIEFTPTADRLEPGRNETVTFRVSIDDDPDESGNDLVVREQVKVLVVSENDEPLVVSPPSGRREVVSSGGAILPFDPADFPTFEIQDSDRNDHVTVTLRLDDPDKGWFTDGTDTIVESPPASGVYQGTFEPTTTEQAAALALEALRDLVFNLDPAFPVPAGAPGIEVFVDVTIADRLGLNVSFSFSLLVRVDQVMRVVTNTDDDGPGSLRQAIAEAQPNDHIAFDLSEAFEITPRLTIHLQSPLVIDKNLTIIGPGVEKLSLSGDTDADGDPDVQIFQIGTLATDTADARAAYLHLSYLTLTHGSDEASAFGNGGAVSVGRGSTLVADHVEFLDSFAEQWGGAVDVFHGRIEVSHCLFAGNRTGEAMGAGGGAVAFLGRLPASFVNTTFSGNVQGGASGAGGGALFLENEAPDTQVTVRVAHCSFVANVDAARKGSSIRTNVFNIRAELQNCLLADGDPNPLDPRGAGRIISLGGNVADDDTQVILSQGGLPVAVILLDQPSDVRSASLVLEPLADNGGQTRTHALPGGSPARGAAVAASDIGTDQRDVWRGGDPDAGAFEADTFKRIVINEIQFEPATGDASWVEIVNPRDSELLDLLGHELWVQGVLRHVFTAQSLPIGSAVLVKDETLPIIPSPPGGFPTQEASVDGALALGSEGGVVEVRSPNGAVVASATYLADFLESGTLAPDLRLPNQSVTRNCEFLGAFLTPGLDDMGDPIPPTPGTDGSGVPLIEGNAPPIAFDDEVEIDEDNAGSLDPLVIDVLANDFDADRTDVIRVVEPLPASQSTLGADLSIIDDPEDGAAVGYDPTTSPRLQALALGFDAEDTFEYIILDYANGTTANARVRNPPIDDALEQEEADANLLRATGEVTVHVIGVNDAPTPQDDKLADLSDLETDEATAITFAADDLLLNDTDPDNGESGTEGIDDDITAVPPGDRLMVTPDGRLRICWVKPFGFDIGDKDPTRVELTDLVTTSELGARVELILRADRAQSTITYDPSGSAVLDALAAGETAVDRFTYLVIDPHGAPGIATVCIKVTGVNDAPVANDDGLFATDEDSSLEIPDSEVLANDTDVDVDFLPNGDPKLPNDVLSVFSVDSPSALGADVSFVAGEIVYDPRSAPALQALSKKEVVIDTFVYTISDGNGGTSSAVVSLQVTGVNDRPIANDDVYTGAQSAQEDNAVDYSAADGVLLHGTPDTDIDRNGSAPDDVLRALALDTYTKESVAVITTSLGATVTLNADGSFDYDPLGLFEGLGSSQTTVDTFEYTVTDDSLIYANGDSFQVAAGSIAIFLDVLRNDVNLSHAPSAGDPPNVVADDCPIVVSVDPPSHGGTASIAADGLGILYTPAFGFVGVETFTYHVSDGPNGFCMAEVRIDVVPASGPLTGKADFFQVAPNGTADLDLLANDLTLPGGAILALQSLTLPDQGGTATIALVAGRTIARYTPAAGFIGTETFTYTATAGGGTSFGAEVTVVVPGRSGALKPQDDVILVVVDSGENALDLLANDGILPANAALWSVDPAQLGLPDAGGSASVAGDGRTILYTPGPGLLVGNTESFDYTVVDAYGGTGTATATIRIVNEGLFAADDTFAVNWNSTANVLPVVANDKLIPDSGERIEITFVETPDHGTVAWNTSRSALVYTPTPGFSGLDTFSYEIGAATHPRQAASVTVDIIDRTGELPAGDDFYCVAGDSGRNALRVLANDRLPPLGTPSLIITGTYPATTVEGATLELGNGGTFLFYTPPAGFIGTDTFTYTFTDGRGGTGSAAVTVKVGHIFVGDDAFTVLSGTTDNFLDILANDSRVPGGKPTLLGPAGNPAGVVANSDDSALLYTPPAGFTGVTTFTYEVEDDTGEVYTGNVLVRVLLNGSDRDNALVQITVQGANDAPTIAGVEDIDFLRDDDVAKPFTNVVIGDVDGDATYLPNGTLVAGTAPAPLTVKVVIDDPEKGELVNLVPGFPDFAEDPLEPGTYVFVGSPADATTAIQELCFIPTEDRIEWSKHETTILTICVSDGIAPEVKAAANIEVFNIGQQFGDNWIFGSGITMQWDERRNLVVSTKAPFSLPLGGGGTWSDPETGDWIVYTDGVSAWDAQTGQVLPGANGTLGGSPSNNSIPAMIIPVPGGDPRLDLYVFSFASQNRNIRITRLDLRPGANFGVVGAPGVAIAGTSPSQEGWAILPHANGTDYWMIIGNGNAYPVTAAGVGTPVTNFNLDGSGSSFRYNPDGSRIAVGWSASKMNIFDFDPITGQFGGGKIELLRGDAYFEFSHDGTRIYVNDTRSEALYQYDLTADPGPGASSSTRSAAVQATEILLHNYSGSDYAGDMALGPDGKIYVVGDGSSPAKLHVINNPDGLGLACDLALDAIMLPDGYVLRQGLYHGLRVDDLINDPMDLPPIFEVGTVPAVSNAGWTTVSLDRSYASMVVVATPQYGAGTTPLVTRIRNAVGDQFELQVARMDNVAGAVSATVRYVVVEEGAYTLAAHGIKMEAVRYLSTSTDRRNSFSGQSRNYMNSYSSPVVVGQVMTSNDARPSVFWARGNNSGTPPTGNSFSAGKHVGADSITSRANETIGYIVVESGQGIVGELAYSALVGSDSVQGFDNSPPYNYAVSGIASPLAAVVSSAAMDDSDGGWPIIYGTAALAANTIPLAIDEDRFADSERSHSTEQVAVLVIGDAGSSSPLLASAAASLDQWRRKHFTDEELTAPVSGSAVWSLTADPDADGRTNLAEYAFGSDPRRREGGDALATWVEPSAVGGESLLKISFLRRTGDPLMRYALEESSDLQGWSSASSRQSRVVPVEGTGYELVVLAVDRPPVPEQRFYRVKASR